MRFSQACIPGVWLIDLDPVVDERGMFARSYCSKEFSQHDLKGDFCQQSVSWNLRAGTLRGMHAQASPHEEEKLVRVTRGAVYDVVVDIRPDSSTFQQWFGVELSADNRRQLYIPKGVAHGFLTLTPETEVFYQMTVPYHPESAQGFRWNDPAFAIVWPRSVDIISERDKNYPLFQR